MTETIGEQLKKHRKAHGITLEEIAQKTHIRLAYLKAIEEGDLDAIPSPVQLRGFLRLYAGVLNVEIENLQVQDYHLTPQSAKRSEDKQNPSLDAKERAASTFEEASPDLDKREKAAAETETINDEKENAETASSQESRPIPADEETFPPTEKKESASLFKSIGKTLFKRRELLSLSLEDIENHIHVRSRYLQAIENGQFENLPSPVQAKGMLANYAEFLNLDSDDLLLTYADALQKQRLEKQEPHQRAKKPAKQISRTKLSLKNFFSLDLLIITLLFIGFAAFVIWGVNRILPGRSSQSAATDLPEVAEVLLATGTATIQTPNMEEQSVTTTPGGSENTQAQNTNEGVEATPIFTPAAGNNPIQIVIIPRQGVWVRVSVDGETAYEGRLQTGNAYDFSGEEKVEVLTGNAAALQITFNDQDIGSTGLMGQVMNLVFTEFGLVLPTPTSTPTITETPQTTPTPTHTPSPTPTELETND